MSFAGEFRRPSSWRAGLVGAVVAALATLPGLGVGTLWDNSETVYGEVAREILLFGDPIVMHLNAHPWFVQPPLFFWVAALSAKLFGVNAWALRLPSALATIGMGAAVGLCAGRLVSLRAAIFCSIILSTTIMQAVIGRLAIMDALLDLAVTLTIFGVFAALRSGRERYWYGAWVTAALGFLAKGPVAIVVPALVLAVWIVWERRRGDALQMPNLRAWLLAPLCMLVIVLPWMVLLARAAGPASLAEVFGHYSVGRYLGAIENQSGPLWYYLPVIVLGFFPWSAFLIPALGRAWHASREPQAALLRLCFAWSIVPFVFFSLAQTKLPNYIALMIPAQAMLVAIWFDGVVDRGDRRWALAWAAFVPATIGGVAIAIRLFSQSNRLSADLHTIVGDIAWLGVTTLTGSILCFCLLVARRTAPFAPLALAGAGLGSMFIIAFVAEPHAERFKPIPKLAAAIEREQRSGDVIAISGVPGSYALEFYTRPSVLVLDTSDVTTSGDAPHGTLCTAPRAFLVTSRALSAEMPASSGRRRREVAHEAGDVLYLYDGRPCG